MRRDALDRDIPEAIRSLSTIGSADYVDLFTLMAPEAENISAEQWAGAVVEGAVRSGGDFVWRVLLCLRLESRRSPGSVAGWKIARRGSSWISVEAASWFMTANIVFRVDEGQVSFATLIRYDRPAATLLWPPVSVMHRRAIPGLLRRGARKLKAGAT